MRVRNKIYEYPEILLVIPILLMGTGYLVMKYPIEISINTLIIGLHIFTIGTLLFALFGFIVTYRRLLKKEVDKRLTKNDKNQFITSYLAGIYGGMTVFAINFILSAKDIFSVMVAGIGFIILLVIGGLFGLAALAFSLEKD